MYSSPVSSLDRNLIDPDIQAILVELASTGAWSAYNGPYLQALAVSLQNRFLRSYVQLCCSGTLAIELALRGCRIESGDEVLMAAYDFPGNFRAIEAVGASVAIVDIPSGSWSLSDIDELDRATSRITKAVIVSHLHGTSAAMSSICDWARAREIRVIEDVCQASGAIVDGRPAGTWGDCSVLSFGGSKLLSAGRGGAILTNDPRIDQRIRIYRERGNDAFALSELQAAVLGPQLKKLDDRHAMRASAVIAAECTVSRWKWLVCPKRGESIANSAFYKWGFQIVPSVSSTIDLRNAVLSNFEARSILAGPGFHGFGGRSLSRCRRLGPLPNAEHAAESTILIHHTMLNPTLSDHLSAIDRQLHDANLIDE